MALSRRTRRILILVPLTLLLLGAGVYMYVASEKFGDTRLKQSDFSVTARDFIREFEADQAAANLKYNDKIVTVSGRVNAVEPADTAINVKFVDTTSGSYIIFAFQDQDLPGARKLGVGDSVSIKGSFSSGLYSDILGTTFITFKRSALEKIITKTGT
ncbi:MAG TPA: hypothetical protein VEB63_04385 [Chitinophagaceae bacterium]|nr:hypothetical protein [Chitinophagaceae bacterium]